jgi:hypothetical protein
MRTFCSSITFFFFSKNLKMLKAHRFILWAFYYSQLVIFRRNCGLSLAQLLTYRWQGSHESMVRRVPYDETPIRMAAVTSVRLIAEEGVRVASARASDMAESEQG